MHTTHEINWQFFARSPLPAFRVRPFPPIIRAMPLLFYWCPPLTVKNYCRADEMKLSSIFCSSTSLHGWPHLQEAKGLAKLFWGLTIIGSQAFAAFLSMRCIVENFNVSISFSVLNHYLNATVRTSLETSTAELSRAKFPKIVICNSFQLRWQKLVFLIRSFFKAIYSQDLWRILLQCIHWWFELCYQQAASHRGDWRGDWVKELSIF